MSERRSAAAKKTSAASADLDSAGAGMVAAMESKKHPIETLVTTLPLVMLLAGLAFYFLNERRQVDGQIQYDQVQRFDGEYSGISQQSDKPDAQRIVWIQTPARLRGGRVDYQQAQQLKTLSSGDPISVWAAPKIAGSNTLWVVKVSSNGKPLFDISPVEVSGQSKK